MVDTLVSRSGRILQPPQPKRPITTNRRARNAITKMDAWLLDEAFKEATEYECLLLAGVGNPFSPADRDMVLSILTGTFD